MTARSLAACIVVPTYDNPKTLRAVVEGAHVHCPEVIVVDDGSGPEGREAAAALARDGLARVVHRARNGGKGAAVLSGLRLARELGFTHALQVDADGQHDLADIPRFLAAARERPEAFVAGEPVFDESAPRSRLVGRRITQLWAAIETGGPVVRDTLCGLRVYPVAATLAAGVRSRRMEFDNEVAVRLYWAGVPVVNVPTRIRYLDAASGGVSHYRLVRDNVLMSLMHSRLACQAAPRVLVRWVRWGR